MDKIRIGSRGSELARWQAEHVAGLLRSILPNRSVEVVTLITTGDRVLDTPLPVIGGKGLFTKEIEDALIGGRVDLAVHSLKDLPTVLPDGLRIGAILSRTDPSDVLVSRGGLRLAELRPGARIGTSSTRRRAQISYLRRDVLIEDLRGNVPTRLEKVLSGRLDGAVLARAGLERLGLLEHVAEVLSAEMMLPAPGQGALGVEIRADDAELAGVLERLEDHRTRTETAGERAFLAALGGGCQVPVGALGRVLDAGLTLDGIVAEPDGSNILRGQCRGPAIDAISIGRALADELLAQGARDILARVGVGSAGGGE